MKYVFLGVLLAAIPLLTLADDTALYQIELIIFENLSSTTQGTEVWRRDPGTPDVSDASLLITSANVKSPTDSANSPGDSPDTRSGIPDEEAFESSLLRKIPEGNLKLTPLKRKMLNSGKYHPLVHTGWIQSLAESDPIIPVRLYSGIREASSTAADLYHPLDGKVKISRGRYLHIDADLIYFRKSSVQPPASPTPAALPQEDAFTEQARLDTAAAPAAQGPAWLAYRMVESRRTRSDELQYFDHPLFGMLIQISPAVSKK